MHNSNLIAVLNLIGIVVGECRVADAPVLETGAGNNCGQIELVGRPLHWLY